MSDEWVKGGDRLAKSLGITKANEVREAMRDNNKGVGKRLLHVDSDGNLHQYTIDAKGKIKPLSGL
ncbi:MAG TPA: hypothetical protein VF629_19240 [Hymenobacter sp.]|jgi:hypothetical protein|uniref:hypothetical protein n=1 Tax=Hymenobacter sp. TaxID=1898978 RepID=UPI002ED78CE3